MKKSIAIIAIAMLVIFAVAHFVFNFFTNDTIDYYAQQPWRFLLVGFIGIAGGLIAFLYNRLCPRLSRTLKLCVLGSAASALTVLTCCFFAIFVLSSQLGAPEAGRNFVLVALGFGINIVLLWLEFYQVFKRRSE